MKSSLLRTAVLSAALAMMATGCASMGYEHATQDADAALKKAASVGGEWRDTRKVMKKAAKAAAAGEYDKATKLANKAKQQGEMGYAQAMAEKTADGSYLFK